MNWSAINHRNRPIFFWLCSDKDSCSLSPIYSWLANTAWERRPEIVLIAHHHFCHQHHRLSLLSQNIPWKTRMLSGVWEEPVGQGQAVYGGEQSTHLGKRCLNWLCPARTPWHVLLSQNCTCAFSQLVSHWELELTKTSLAQLVHTAPRKLDIQHTPLK